MWDWYEVMSKHLEAYTQFIFVKKGKAQKVQVPERLKGLISKYGHEIFSDIVLLGIKE